MKRRAWQAKQRRLKEKENRIMKKLVRMKKYGKGRDEGEKEKNTVKDRCTDKGCLN